ncbi:pentatricopeptide repeat-containing protein [Tanacetum coccineum]
MAGCIPVFFEELSAKKQYVWHLPEDEYDEFSVMILKEDVVFKGASVVEVLKGIPKSRVRKMRKKLIEMIPRIVYRRHGSSLGLRNQKDAFDIAVEGVEEHQSIPTLTSVKEILTSAEDVPVEPEIVEPPKKKPPRGRFNPCKVELTDAVDELVEPNAFGNFVNFSLNYVAREDIPSLEHPIIPRFGGHQTLEEREQSFHAANQTIHCGFVEGSEGSPSTGFDLDKDDKMYMNTCTVVVSSCIFGSSDFLRRPTSKMISQYSKKSVCFIMFVDKETLVKLSKEGSTPDERGFVGLWRIVVVSNLPYDDMRKTGKLTLPFEVPTLGVVAYGVVAWTRKKKGANRDQHSRDQRARSGGLWSGGLDPKRGASRDQRGRWLFKVWGIVMIPHWPSMGLVDLTLAKYGL